MGRLQHQSQLMRMVLCMQWAATLTQNGANLPFVSPLKADKLPGGFQVNIDGQLTAVTALVQSGSNNSPSAVVPPGESLFLRQVNFVPRATRRSTVLLC